MFQNLAKILLKVFKRLNKKSDLSTHKNHIYLSICLRMSGGGSVWHGHEVMNNNIEHT